MVGRSPGALSAAAAHALAAVSVPQLRSRLERSAPAALRWVLAGYPLAFLALFWAELGWLHALRGLEPHDAFVRELDLALFGVHWEAVWAEAMPARWLSEGMHLSYFLYYPVLLVPPILIARRAGERAFRSAVLALTATYLTCFLFYLAFPVVGPRAWPAAGEEVGMEAAGREAAGGFFHELVERARESGDSPGTAFPSSHVAGAFTVAWLAWRWLGRRWGLTLGALALAIALSTVYTRNHYAVDALAGLLWILPLHGWLTPALERRPAGVSSPR